MINPYSQFILLFLSAMPLAVSQSATGSIGGNVLDAKSQVTIPTALVTATRLDLPPVRKSTKSGGDGSFRIEGLPAGNYSLCVQAPGNMYLDPCEWESTSAGITLVSGQAANGVSLKLIAASILNIQVQDTQHLLSQKTKEGRTPDLSVGVWGPKGLYHPAHSVAGGGPSASLQSADGDGASRSYHIAVPRDIALKLHIASRDLRLGDRNGASLAGNRSQQSFQHGTGETNPASFVFTVVGLLP